MLRRVVAVVLVLVLAACGELPRPFQPEYKADDNPLLIPRDRAGIVVRPVAGLPEPAASAFTAALVEALRKEDIVAMSGSGNAASMLLVGTADAAAPGWDFTFALADARSAQVGSLTTHIDPGSPDDPKAWAPYTARLAKSFAAMLEAPGTQLGDQPTVAVGEVTGVPAEEGRALSRALEYTLKRAQVQVADSPDKATHIVTAVVNVAPPRGSPGREVRNVDVRWVVLRADRSEIGDVRQANDVPVRLLERAWPDIALAVADSATGSIADLIKRPATAVR